jgi:hypothetical protein
MAQSANPFRRLSFAVKCEVWTLRHKDMEKEVGGEWSKYHAGLSSHGVLIRGCVLANRNSAGTGDPTLESRTERGLR